MPRVATRLTRSPGDRHRPDEAVAFHQADPGSRALQDMELVAQSEVLEGGALSGSTRRAEQVWNDPEHRTTLPGGGASRKQDSADGELGRHRPPSLRHPPGRPVPGACGAGATGAGRRGLCDLPPSGVDPVGAAEWISSVVARQRKGAVMATRSKRAKSKATAKKSVRKVRRTASRNLAKPCHCWGEEHPRDPTGAVI
jgi:hypothetical protein